MSESVLRDATLVFVGAEESKCGTLPETIRLFDVNDGGEVVIGTNSKQCNVLMQATELPPFVSGRHAKFVFDQAHDMWTVEDLESRNGVYINTIKIEGHANLKHGDKISFGPPVNVQQGHIGEGTGDYLYEFQIPRSTRQELYIPELARNTTLQYSPPLSGEPDNAVEQDGRGTLQRLLEYSCHVAELEGKKEKSLERFNLSESGVEDLLWTEEVHLKDVEGVEVMAFEGDGEREATSSDGTSSAGQSAWIRIERKEAQPLPSLQEPEDDEGKKWLSNPREDTEDGEPRGVRQLQGEIPASVKDYIDRLRGWKQADRLKKLCNGLYDLHLRGELESMEFTAGIGLLRGPFHKEGSESIECAFPVLEFSVKVRKVGDSELPGWFEVYPVDDELSVSAKVFDLFGETATLVRDIVQKSSDTLPSVCYDPVKHGDLLKDIAQLLKVKLWNTNEQRNDSKGDDSKRQLHLEQMWTLHRAPKAQHSNAVAKDANGFQKKLKSGGPGVIPEFCLALTHPDDPRINNAVKDSRSSFSGQSEALLEGLEHEVLFPFQFNDEQQEVMEFSKMHPLVVVDGPPGTGKTQTIANIACNLLAHGKRVLVTSHGAPALEVIMDKMRQALEGKDDFADAILLWNGTKRDAHHQLSKALVFYESCSKGVAKSKTLDTKILVEERAGREKIGENIRSIDRYLELWSRWMIDPLKSALCGSELEEIVTSFEECMGTKGTLATLQDLQNQQRILLKLLSQHGKDLLDLDGAALASRISKNGVQAAQDELCLDEESLPRATEELVEFLQTGASAELQSLEITFDEVKKKMRPVLALMESSGRPPENVAVLKRVLQSPCQGKILGDQDKGIRKRLGDLRAVLLFLRNMPEVKLEDLETVWSYDASTVLANCNTIRLSPVQLPTSGAALPQMKDEVMQQLRECVASHCSLSDSLREAIRVLKVRDSEGNELAPQTAEYWRSVEQFVSQQAALNQKILKLPKVLSEHLERSPDLAQSISEVTLLAGRFEGLVDKFETSQLSQENLQFVLDLPKSKFETLWRVDNAKTADAIIQSDAGQLKEAHIEIESLRQDDSSFAEGCKFEVQWCGQTLFDLGKVDIAVLIRTATAELEKQTKEGFRGLFQGLKTRVTGMLFSSSSAGKPSFFDNVTINHKSISNAEDWKRAKTWLKSIAVLRKVQGIYHDKIDFLAGPEACLKAHHTVSDVLHPLFSQLSDDPGFLATFSACVLRCTRQRILSADGLRELEEVQSLAQQALNSIPAEGGLFSKLFELQSGDQKEFLATVSDLKGLQSSCSPDASVSSSVNLTRLGLQTRDFQDLTDLAKKRSRSECAALSANQILDSIDVVGYGASESEYWKKINEWLSATAFLMEKGARIGFSQDAGALSSINDLATFMENRFENSLWREHDVESSESLSMLKKALEINRKPQKLAAELVDDVKSVFLRVREGCVCTNCKSTECVRFWRAAIMHAGNVLCQSNISALADMNPESSWEDTLSSFNQAAEAFDKVDKLLLRFRRDVGLERWAEKLRDSLTGFGNAISCPKGFDASLVDLSCKQFLRSISMARPNAQQMHEWLHHRNELDRQDKMHIRKILQVCIRNSIASRFSKGGVSKLQKVLALSTWLEKTKNKGKPDYEKKRNQLNVLWQDTTIIDTMPIWMMTTDQVSKNLPCAFSCFDVVILDEASQSSILAFPALLRGNRVIVVGDDKQVAPCGDPKLYADLSGLVRQCDIDPEMELDLAPGKSIFDFFKARSAAKRVTLREHYRCLPQIIGFSKEMWYSTMIPLRRDYARKSPVTTMYVKEGQRNGKTQTNVKEAEKIVEMVRKIVTGNARSKEDNKPFSIGIISLWGAKQAKKIETLIDQDPELCAKKTEHSILCGDASKFQGAERDIVLISLVADSRSRTVEADNTSLTDLGPHANVAASRGKEKLYIFHSFSLHNSKFSEKDWRRKLLTHYHNNQGWWHEVPPESPFAPVISDQPKVRIMTIKGNGAVTVEIAEVFCAGSGPLAFVLHRQQSRDVALETWKQEFKCSCILTRMGWNVSWLWESDAALWSRHTAQQVTDLIQELSAKAEHSTIKPMSDDSTIAETNSEANMERMSENEEQGVSENTAAQRPEPPMEGVRDEPAASVAGGGGEPQEPLATTGGSVLGQGGGETSNRGGATKRPAPTPPRAGAAEDYVLTEADVNAVLDKAYDLPNMRSILASIKTKTADFEGRGGSDIPAGSTKPELLKRMVEIRVKDSEGVAGLVEWMFVNSRIRKLVETDGGKKKEAVRKVATKSELVKAAGDLKLQKVKKALEGLAATNKKARKSDGANCPSEEEGEKTKKKTQTEEAAVEETQRQGQGQGLEKKGQMEMEEERKEVDQEMEEMAKRRGRGGWEEEEGKEALGVERAVAQSGRQRSRLSLRWRA